MAEPAFLADEDFREDIVHAALRMRADIDLVTVRQLHLSGVADSEILQIAFDAKRILLSHDVNSMRGEAARRIQTGEFIAGLLLAKQTASRRGIAETIVLISLASDADDWHNVIDFVPW